MTTNVKYLFIDESGNFDFSPQGTKHFVLTGLLMTNPSKNLNDLSDIKYEALVNGQDIEYFHASEDPQNIRDKIFDFLKTPHLDIQIYSVISEKKNVQKDMYVEKYLKRGKHIERVTGYHLYQSICLKLLKLVGIKSNDHLIVVLGSLFTREKHAMISGTIKKYLKTKRLSSYWIYFHQTKSDFNSQLADYCSWGIYVKMERGEARPYRSISGKITKLIKVFEKK